MPRKKTLGAALAAVLALAGVAGCGSTSASSPSQAVSDALQADLNQNTLQMVVRMQGTVSDFQLNSQSSGLTPSQQQAVLNSHLVVTVHGAGSTPVGKVSATSGNNAIDVALVDGSDNLADLRYIGDNLYMRVDIPKLTSDYSLNKGSVATFRGELQAVASQISAVGALNNGQWVSINVAQAESLAASQLHVSSALLPHLNPGELIQVVDSVLTGLQHNSKVTAGSSSGQYQMTVNDKGMASTLGQAVSSAPGVSAIPNVGNLQKSVAGISSTSTTKVDVTVSNGKVTQLSLPVSQFGKVKGNGQVVVAISTTGSVSAPSGATPVNLSQVASVIGQLVSAGG